MVIKKGRKPTKKQIEDSKKLDLPKSDTPTYSAAVMGAIAPLQRVADNARAKWGNRLPKLVPPALSARFAQVYDDLHTEMIGGSAVKVHEIASRLMTAWGVMEKAAMDAGHRPIDGRTGFVVDIEGRRTVCICAPDADVVGIKRDNPDWVVYSADNAARIIARDFSEDFITAALDSFPSAKVTRVKSRTELERELDDEIPF